jgi:hypothetical protein
LVALDIDPESLTVKAFIATTPSCWQQAEQDCDGVLHPPRKKVPLKSTTAKQFGEQAKHRAMESALTPLAHPLS